MNGKKASKLGFKPKTRTIQQVNNDYNQHAAQAGHKGRIINKLFAEIEQHNQTMEALEIESKTATKDAPLAAAPTPETTETPTEGTA